MFGKLYASIYCGTLRGRPNELLVFTNMVATADAEGVVDKHFRAIAEEVGLSIPAVRKAVAELEAPDPESRSPEASGARLVRVDKHRDWGWRIVNYIKYRNIRNAEDRREQNRQAQARFRSKHDVSEVSHGQPPSAHAEAEAEAEAVHTERGASKWPTEEEVIERGKFIGLTEDSCRAFWNHYEASGWVDGNGHAIAKWQPKLAGWKIKNQSRAAAPAIGAGGGGGKSLFHLKTVMEAKEKLAANLFRKYASECAGGTEWSDKNKRVEYAAMKKEIRELNEQIARAV